MEGRTGKTASKLACARSSCRLASQFFRERVSLLSISQMVVLLPMTRRTKRGEACKGRGVV